MTKRIPTSRIADSDLERLMRLGKNAVLSITGMVEDAYEITTPKRAMDAIEECMSLGYEAHNERNRLALEEINYRRKVAMLAKMYGNPQADVKDKTEE